MTGYEITSLILSAGAIGYSIYKGWKTDKRVQPLEAIVVKAGSDFSEAKTILSHSRDINELIAKHAEVAANAAKDSAGSAREVLFTQKQIRRHEILSFIKLVYYNYMNRFNPTFSSEGIKDYYQKSFTLRLQPEEYNNFQTALLECNDYFIPKNDEEKRYSLIVYENFTQTHKPTRDDKTGLLVFSNVANEIFSINIVNLLQYIEGRIKYEAIS